MTEFKPFDYILRWYMGAILASFFFGGNSSGDVMYFLVVIPLLGLINLVLYAPIVGRLMLRKVQWLHQEVTSDIPGNPHAFDDAVISLMRTLPEPANFNVCWTGILLGEPIKIDGVLPPATINSVSLYSRSTSDPPVTLDLSNVKRSPGKKFSVVLAPHSYAESDALKKGSAALLSYPDHWQGGFIAMRNYAVENGTRVITPSVSTIGGKVLRPAKALVAGLTAVKNLPLLKIGRVVMLNTLIFGVRVCQKSWSLFERQLLVGGLVVGALMYSLLFLLGKRGLVKHFTAICPRMNEFRRPDEAEASEVSQPSKEHMYWLMRYDVNSLTDNDIIVNASVKSDAQKYWSLTLYDAYGLPIPQFVNVYNIDRNQDDEKYEIEIRLTTKPKAFQTDSPPRGKARAVVDVSGLQIGYAIFRIVHPTTDKINTTPIAKIVKSV